MSASISFVTVNCSLPPSSPPELALASIFPKAVGDSGEETRCGRSSF